jgi:hypothetical protein
MNWTSCPAVSISDVVVIYDQNAGFIHCGVVDETPTRRVLILPLAWWQYAVLEPELPACCPILATPLHRVACASG